MSNSKISSIALYVVAAISLIVILFFYIGPRTVDIDAIEAQVDKLTTTGEEMVSAPAETAAADTTASDSAGMAMADSAAMDSDADTVVLAAAVEDVSLEEVDLSEYLGTWELMVYKRTDYALKWAYILLAIAAIAALLFPLITIVTDLKAILRLLALLAGAAVLLLVSYFVFASDATIDILGYTGTDNSDPTTLKWIGTGLFSTYIIFGLALLSILYSEVANLFK